MEVEVVCCVGVVVVVEVEVYWVFGWFEEVYSRMKGCVLLCERWVGLGWVFLVTQGWVDCIIIVRLIVRQTDSSEVRLTVCFIF